MITKKYIWSLIAIAMASTISLGLSSCFLFPDDDDPTLSVDKTFVSLAANGDGDNDIEVSASHTDWTASVTEGSPWLRVNKNGQHATISVDENKTTTLRTGKIRITATADAKLFCDVSVNQAGADVILSISPSELTFSAEGGSQTFQIISNSKWTISDDPNWVTVTSYNGDGNKNINIKVTENTTSDKRTCNLSVSTDDGSQSTILKITQEKPSSTLSVGSNNIIFSSGDEKHFQGETRSLLIRSNTSWDITGLPNWLNISSTSGNGEQTVSLTTKSFNNSSKPLTATLSISTKDGSSKATVDLTQEAGLAPECTVTPTNIISLFNGIAFDYNFGKKVARYFRGYLKKSEVGVLSESEIITILEEKFDRIIVNKDDFTDFPGLEENTAYYIYTLGYDINGKRGDLSRVEFSTKKRLNNWQLNEPMAWVGEIGQNASVWFWKVTKGTRCRTYLEAATENEELAYSSDVCQAWLLDYWLRTGQIYEYENPETLYVNKTGSLCSVFTWGKDNSGNWASCIDYSIAYNSSSAKKKAPSLKTKNTKKIMNHQLPKKGTYWVRRIRKQ